MYNNEKQSIGVVTLRYLFFIALALIAGIYTAYEWQNDKEWKIAVVVALLACFVFIGFFTGKDKLKIVATVCAIACVVGFGVFQIQYSYIESQRIGSKAVILKGYACELTELNGNRLHGYLRNCEIVSADGKTEKLRGCVSVDAYGVSEALRISPGDIIEMKCKVNDVFVFREGIDTTALRQSNFYCISEIIGQIAIVKGKPNIRESVREYISDRYTLYLSEDNYGVAMAIVLGDRSMLSDELSTSYRKTGLAHLFSVSGLHVGFIAGCLSWILKKLRLKRYATFCVVTIGMIAYGWICGFPYSVVRAILMSSLSILVLYREADLLSNISFAAICMMLFNPLVIFDGAFQMSFGAVFGIATIGNQINALYKRRQKNGRLQGFFGSLSACGGATLGTLPFVLIYYGEISLVSPLCNLLTVSVMSVVFVLLIIGLVPFLSWSLLIPNLMISGVNGMLQWASGLSFATVNANAFGYTAIFFFVLMMLTCGEIGLKGKKKICVSLILIVIIVTGTFVTAIPERTRDKVVYTEYGYAIFVSDEGDIALVTDLKSVYTAYKIIDDLKVYGDVGYDLYISDSSKTSPSAISVLIKEKKVCLERVCFLDEKAENAEAYYVAAAKENLIEDIRDYKGFGIIAEYLNQGSLKKYIGLRVFFNNKEYMFAETENYIEFLSRRSASLGFVVCGESRLKEIDELTTGLVVTSGYGYSSGAYGCRREGRLEIYL